ncbi:iron(III) transport system substrate-binding protein [Yoonia maricola]|uniref:Iron(III) transport system substrate-binding protein n=1 Tax=Yoonia maricola TaxID=420999 RepID=A0A2M8WLG8_9RHOB|nr:ABC transporter substrate-binding protein [Yoonia maricola]PJI91763.1 iron(III) transport system substrate-binding protein [Yoonia maricola]
MRFTDLACRLIAASYLAIFASCLNALELEDRQRYPGTGDTMIKVISTGDLAVFEPFILQFQAENPAIGIDYYVTSSAVLHTAIKEGDVFDIAMSSAMDLQFQLANDGAAQRFTSPITESLPGWARWRNQVFAFTAEPAVAVISRARFAGLERPKTRQELIGLLRQNPTAFEDAIGTYDVRTSGLGYLFATQEARNSDTFWRLFELMGRRGTELYCCSAQMIDDVASGRLTLAYNVLGSYTAERIARDDRLEILTLEDYETVMLRTALIPATATEVEAAGLFLDRLLQEGMRETSSVWALPPLRAADTPEARAYGPIRLGPGLLVYLDKLNRDAFLGAWSDAIVQP